MQGLNTSSTTAEARSDIFGSLSVVQVAFFPHILHMNLGKGKGKGKIVPVLN
jgi:hypothetical protein